MSTNPKQHASIRCQNHARAESPWFKQRVGRARQRRVWCAQSRCFNSPTSSGSSKSSAADESTSATSVKPDVSRDMAAEIWLQMRLFVDCRTLSGQAMGALLVVAPTLPLGFDCPTGRAFPQSACARTPGDSWAKNGAGQGRAVHACSSDQQSTSLDVVTAPTLS